MSELSELPDDEFAARWQAMKWDDRQHIPADEQADHIARYKRLRPRGPPRYSEGNNGYERLGDAPMAPSEHAGAPAAGWPNPLDLEALAEREPEPPRFIVPDWLPAGYATLLAGHGGVGKSAIALHLAVCLAAGCPFFGMVLSPRRVLYLSCEDREQVLHWRLARICAYLQINLSTLRGWLDILDLVGAETILWDRDPRTGSTVTLPSEYLRDRIKGAEPGTERQVVIVDGISDVFGGNENARGDVKRFVNSLVAQISPVDGAVILVGHVAKPSATLGAQGDGYSGSTAWHNAVRARWYLYPETEQTDDGDRAGKTGELVLELQKSNLGRTDQSLRFRWDQDAALFVGEEQAQQTHLDRKIRDQAEQAGILRAFLSCGESPVPAAMNGPRSAYLVLSNRPEFPQSLAGGTGWKTARFRHQIEALRQIGYIAESSYRRANRHVTAILVLTTEGRAACVE